jgi:hypothetical protein
MVCRRIGDLTSFVAQERLGSSRQSKVQVLDSKESSGHSIAADNRTLADNIREDSS